MAIIHFHEGYLLLCHHNHAEAKGQWNVYITCECGHFVVVACLFVFVLQDNIILNIQACIVLTLSGLKLGMTVEGIDRGGEGVLRTLWMSHDLKYM